MRFKIHSHDTSLQFRLLSTPLFCGTEPIRPDESIFPSEIDHTLFPKNVQRLFSLLNAFEYKDVVNVSYLTLLKDSRIRKVTVDLARSLISELFYGEPGKELITNDKKNDAVIKDTFPEFLFLEGERMEIDNRLKGILDQPLKRHSLKFSAKNKRFISSSTWVKKVYHLYNLLVFFPDEYLDQMPGPKDSLGDLNRAFISIINSTDEEILLTKTIGKDPILEAAIRLKSLIQIQDDRTRDFIKQRFEAGMDMRAIGRIHNISSERVRQKLVAFIEDARQDLSTIERRLQNHILNHLLKNPKVIEREFFTNQVLNIDAFVRILNTIFPAIPSYANKFFVSQNIYREENPLYSLYTRLRSYLREKDGVPVSKFLDDFTDLDGWEKLNIFKLILAIRFFKVIEKDGEYILRGRMNLPEMAEQTLNNSDRAMSLKEIIDSVKVQYGRVYTDLKVSLCHIRMNSNVLQLDKDIFGVKKHLSLEGEQMRAVQKKVADYLEKEKKIVDASVLYRLVRKDFPSIRSKYELVQFLRLSDEITDLGFFCFIHNSVNMEERKIVNEYLIEILEKNNYVMHGKELLAEINKDRVVSVTGFSSKLQNVSFIDSYGGNFYGLANHRKQNLKTLSSDPLFISNLIMQNLNPDTRFSLLEQLFQEFDFEKVKQTINKSNLFVVYDHPSIPGDKLVLSKYWKRNKLYYIILYAYNKPVTITELDRVIKPLGFNGETIKKINFYALGIDVFKDLAWIKDKVPEPEGLQRRKRVRAK